MNHPVGSGPLRMLKDRSTDLLLATTLVHSAGIEPGVQCTQHSRVPPQHISCAGNLVGMIVLAHEANVLGSQASVSPLTYKGRRLIAVGSPRDNKHANIC